MTARAIVGVLWLVFMAVWVLSAVRAKRSVVRSNRIWFLRLAIASVFVFSFSKPGSLMYISRFRFSVTPAVQAAGVLLTALGVGFAVWARLHLGRNWGMPMSVQENAELVTSGPYAYVRNPIYSGILLAMLGSAVVTRLWWLVIMVIAGIYFVYSAKREEALLVDQFPSTFPAYRARTRMLIPFVF
jgi:protein-S-isoprenylcysteine O-methyltransferase Ste14